MMCIENPLISIIVPVYNAEKYLPRCLDSILNQTYKNLEVICIDDGSQDRSGEIIDSYKKADPRIVHIAQDNKGQGYTRCKGIKISKGDYIALVDDDDYILPDMYRTMLDTIIKYNVDVCVCQWDYETIDGSHTISREDVDESIYGYHTSIDFAHYLYKRHKATGYGYSNGVVVSPWNKLFKKEIIADVVFSGYIGEDEEMNDQVNSKNCRIYVIPDVFYYWCENRASMSHQPFSEKRFHFLDMLEKRKLLFAQDSYIVHETEKLYCNLYVEYYFKSAQVGIKMLQRQYGVFKKMYGKLCKSYYCDKKFYLRMLLFLLSPYLYEKITKL